MSDDQETKPTEETPKVVEEEPKKKEEDDKVKEEESTATFEPVVSNFLCGREKKWNLWKNVHDDWLKWLFVAPEERIDDQLDSLGIFEESWRRYGRKIAQSPVPVEPVITFSSANDVLENHFFFGDNGRSMGVSVCSAVIHKVGSHWYLFYSDGAAIFDIYCRVVGDPCSWKIRFITWCFSSLCNQSSHPLRFFYCIIHPNLYNDDFAYKNLYHRNGCQIITQRHTT